MQHVAKAVARGLILALVLAVARPGFADRAGAKINGTIAAIDQSAGSLTVTAARGGASVTLTVDGRTVVTINGRRTSFTNLAVGNQVDVRYNASTLVAQTIAARVHYTPPPPSPPPCAKADGWISAVDPVQSTVSIASRDGDSTVTVIVDASTVIERNDTTATLADLQVGDRAEAVYSPSTMIATKIEAESCTPPPPPPSLAEVHGSIASVDPDQNSVSIAAKDGNSTVTVIVDASTVIERNDTTATLADLQMGDRASACYDPSTMVAKLIEAEAYVPPPAPVAPPAHISGTIAAVDTVQASVTIGAWDGESTVTVLVDASTVIERNGTTATLADLQVGDKADACYDPSTMVAKCIEAVAVVQPPRPPQPPKPPVRLLEVSGQISAVDQAQSSVTISVDRRRPAVTVLVDASTVITRNRAAATLADLRVNDKATARYDATSMVAATIEARSR
jgi:hypothetical protein